VAGFFVRRGIIGAMDDQRTDREGSMSGTPARRSKFRFSLKTLLLVVLLIAVYFAGRASGLKEGFSDGYKNGGTDAAARLGSGASLIKFLQGKPEPEKLNPTR
jgi:hypothetical protein